MFWCAVALAAACSPAERQQAAAPAPPDTAATRAAIQSLLDDYAMAAKAADVAGVVNLYTDNATMVEYGLPSLTGHAAMEAAYTGVFGLLKIMNVTIPVTSAMVPGPGLASALGTYSETLDSAGTVSEMWGRWAGSFVQDSTGQWRITFLMAFPDSVKAAQ
jgi:ketosteroid isomerase-like protein